MGRKKDKKREMAEEFALKIVQCYRYLYSQKSEIVMSKQLLRAGTSIGANIAEAVYAESYSDYIHKLSIAQKEASETLYWLDLLYRAGYISLEQHIDLHGDCSAILRILTSVISTCKRKLAQA